MESLLPVSILSYTVRSLELLIYEGDSLLFSQLLVELALFQGIYHSLHVTCGLFPMTFWSVHVWTLPVRSCCKTSV